MSLQGVSNVLNLDTTCQNAMVMTICGLLELDALALDFRT